MGGEYWTVPTYNVEVYRVSTDLITADRYCYLFRDHGSNITDGEYRTVPALGVEAWRISAERCAQNGAGACRSYRLMYDCGERSYGAEVVLNDIA